VNGWPLLPFYFFTLLPFRRFLGAVMSAAHSVLVHLGAGIGNIVLATPLLLALHESGFVTDVALAADYPETANLLRPWSMVRAVFTNSDMPPTGNYEYVLPAIPPFYWRRLAHCFRSAKNVVSRPPDGLFYRSEQSFYLSFARTLGWDEGSPPVTLPITSTGWPDIGRRTLVLAPGCKTGEMAKKRWPHFPKLAEKFRDVVVVGTMDDLWDGQGLRLHLPAHVRNLAGCLSLRETAELIATGGAFVGNDSGLSHIAAAVGTPTVMIFGPTSDLVLGALASNVRVVRSGLRCEPCWSNGRFRACSGRIDCLTQVAVETVVRSLLELGFPSASRDPRSSPSSVA
jgi:ADP-heptose:LPS heptosyltransferase